MQIEIRPHRGYVLADSAQPQKLYVLAKLSGPPNAGRIQPSIVFVVDASASMSEEIAPGKSKMSAAQAAIDLVTKQLAQNGAHLSVISFNEFAHVLLPLTSGADAGAATNRAAHEIKPNGGTMMGRGLGEALKQFTSGAPSANPVRKVFLLTDGLTFDAPQCEVMANQLAEAHIGVIALGIGNEYNEELLQKLASRTGGIVYHLEEGKLDYISWLEQIARDDIERASREVYTNVGAALSLTPDVKLERVRQVTPNPREIDQANAMPWDLGNVACGEDSCFLFELEIGKRPEGKIRLGKLLLVFDDPLQGKQRVEQTSDLIVNFTLDQTLAQNVDPIVIEILQRANLGDMVRLAAEQGRKGDVAQAHKTIQVAKNLTKRLNNDELEKMLAGAEQELAQKGRIDEGTGRKLGNSGKTVAVRGGGQTRRLTDEDIRKFSGT